MGLQRRNKGVVHRRFEDGAVAMDVATKHAHALDATASAVWDACDGSADRSQLAARTGLAPSTVDAAVDALVGAGLMTEDGHEASLLSRRKLLAGGAVGGTALVVSIALPTAAFAASGGPTTTTTEPGSTTTGVSSTPSGTTVNVASFSADGPGPSAGSGGSGSGSTGSGGSSGGTLAATGGQVVNEVVGGLALIAAGGVAVGAAHKKHRQAGETTPDAGSA